MPTFPNIDALEAYVDAYIIANGNGEITGPIANEAFNGCIEFLRQSPLNWEQATVLNTTGAVIAPTPVMVFTGSTPSSLTWNDNIYNEYVFINMTDEDIPLLGSLVYYRPTGTVKDNISSHTAVNLFLASNDLWIAGYETGIQPTGQRQPKTYMVGATTGAPTAGTNT